MSAALPRKLFLTHGPVQSRQVCLTFDDGPHPIHTPRLLDVLAAYNVPATFFVVGDQLQRHPEIVRRIAEEGHAIGNHTMHHSDPGTTPASQMIAEVKQMQKMFEKVIGVTSVLFRPPHGKLTTFKLLHLWMARQQVVLWNVDPKDFARKSPSEVSGHFERSPLHGGDIVLMHDNVAHASIVLPKLIATARGDGLSFVPITTWIS